MDSAQSLFHGVIVLDLPGQRATLSDLPDLVLEDGDLFHIPPWPSTESVFGAVYNPNAYVYASGSKVSHYPERAGGPTRDAGKRSVYLVKADGTVGSSRQKGSFAGTGGQARNSDDAVVVPESLDRFNLTKELKEWTQILHRLALGLARLKVLNDL